jgi:lysophospholipase L1-like esterase
MSFHHHYVWGPRLVARLMGSVSSGAMQLLYGEAGGLALDFTDDHYISETGFYGSAAIIDAGTPSNNYNSSPTKAASSLLTFNSPSLKLTMGASGTLRYQAHNLCLQSEDFTTTWANEGSTDAANQAIAPDGTTTADQITETTANAAHGVTQAITLVVGWSYRFSCCIKKAASSRDWFALGTVNAGTGYSYFDLANGVTGTKLAAHTASGIESLGDDWYRVYIEMVPTNTAVTVYVINAPSNGGAGPYVGNTSFSFYAVGAHIRRTPSESAYFKTAASAVYGLPIAFDTAGAVDGLVSEDARTNLCLRSSDLTNASWTKSNMTTSKTATGPDGVANSATIIQASSANGTVLQAITSASATRVTSVYLRRRSGTGNIDITQDNGGTWTTQDGVTSNWKRFSLASVTSTDPTVGIRVVTSGDQVDVALFQHEVGPCASSPIDTLGSTITRAGDFISLVTSAFPFSATEGTLVGHATARAASGFVGAVAPCIVTFGDGTLNEVIYIDRNTTARPRGVITDGGVNQAVIDVDAVGTWANSTAHKLAMSWAANDVAACFDGGAVVADTSATLPTVNNLRIGAFTSTTGGWGGVIKQITYLPRALADAELITRTDVEEDTFTFFSGTLAQTTSGSNLSVVVSIPASTIVVPNVNAPTFYRCRLTFRGQANNVYIGHKAGAGDAYDFAASPTAVTWNGGSATLSADNSTLTVSDEISFTWDGASDILIALEYGAAVTWPHGAVTGYASYTKAATTGETATVNKTGYSTEASTVYGLEKLEFFTLARDVNIVCDGNSLTSGQGSANGFTYPKQLSDLLGGNYYVSNVGVAAKTTAERDAANSTSPRYIAGKRNIAVLWEVSNDLFFGGTQADALARYKTWSSNVRAEGFEVIAMTVLPRSDASTPGSFESDRTAINADLRATLATFADGLADVAADTTLGDSGDELVPTYYPDQVHLTNAGYGIIAATVLGAVT